MKKIFIFILLILIISNLIFCDLFKEQREVVFMASCDLVTGPTGGAPVNVDDYNSQNNILQALLYNLMQNTKHLTEWDTFNEPDMAEGVYVQHGGALFLVKDGDVGIGGAPANGRVYVKATRAGDALTFSFVNSAAGYSWNNVYCGFYHADGTQLLPYVLYKTASGYEKYTLTNSEDKYDITGLIVIHKTVNIGIWDMDTTPQKSVTHGFADESLIRHINAIIINDAGTEYWELSGSTGGYIAISGANIVLTRETGGLFDSLSFNDAAMNRGYVHYIARI